MTSTRKLRSHFPMRVNAKGILRDGDGYENGKKFFSKRRKKHRT